MNRRLVILTNSMGMPRPWIEGDDQSHIDEVFGSLLPSSLGGDWIVDLEYVLTLDSANAVGDFWPAATYREPGVVILHIGIIDCAPRLFRKGSRHLFLQPWFRKVSRDLGMRAMVRYRRQVTKWRRIVYVKPTAFERNMAELREKVRQFKPEARVYALGIAEVTDWLDERNFGYIANIREYNGILKRVFADDYIEVNDLLPKGEFFISDGYHFSLEGHRRVAEVIAKRIEADEPA